MLKKTKINIIGLSLILMVISSIGMEGRDHTGIAYTAGDQIPYPIEYGGVITTFSNQTKYKLKLWTDPEGILVSGVFKSPINPAGTDWVPPYTTKRGDPDPYWAPCCNARIEYADAASGLTLGELKFTLPDGPPKAEVPFSFDTLNMKVIVKPYPVYLFSPDYGRSDKGYLHLYWNYSIYVNHMR